ncbi:MAG: hypothetical protein QOE10_520 [Gaiellales bacterium]|nr:hypothetical protein [Gaiellales bacterium]
MRARACLIGIVSVAVWVAVAAPAGARADKQPAWQGWMSVQGVVDIAGPRSDGRFVVAARGMLFLSRLADGQLSPYPVSGPAYSTNPTLEPYLVVAGPQQRVTAARCSFPRDTVYAIEPAGHPAVRAIAPDGRVRRLAAVPGVKTLNGIAFDSGGRFGGRLLVVGLTADDHGVLVTVDCRGRTRIVTRSAPHLEGGLAIAPNGFGSFAGDLLAPDESAGRLLALSPAGRVRDVVAPIQPAGGDIGVESLGVVPASFGAAYLADRSAPGNANPGHNAILRLTGSSLRGAGVAAGDLLVTLEGGGETLDVHCTTTCTAHPVATAPALTHAEGSIAFAH